MLLSNVIALHNHGPPIMMRITKRTSSICIIVLLWEKIFIYNFSSGPCNDSENVR